MKFINILIRLFVCTYLGIIIGCQTQLPVKSLSETEQPAIIKPDSISADTVALTEVQEPDMISDDTLSSEPETTEQKGTSGFLSNFNIKQIAFERDLKKILEKSPVFSSHFTGFCLYDVERHQFVAEYNADKYFTPASNVKTLTLYTTLRSLGTELPGILFRQTNDTLYLRPVGNPTLLHREFDDQPVIEMIKKATTPVAIEWPDAKVEHFGNGWMWDDYPTKYQPELSWMPVYGNVAYFNYYRGDLKTKPALFTDLTEVERINKGRYNYVWRAEDYNYFTLRIRYPRWRLRSLAPFKYSKSLAVKILSVATNTNIHLTHQRDHEMDTLITRQLDPVLKLMMQESDNFLAEQLLIMSAWKNGFEDFQNFREFVIDNWLGDIKPVWRDGSGLSRYNMIKPVDMVRLFKKLYDEYGWERIHPLLAQGGVAGTIEDWYANDQNPDDPYIFGKTGTLSHNHILSGFLKTRSGKLMIFSLMNNHFTRPTREVKQEMEQILEQIRDAY